MPELRTSSEPTKFEKLLREADGKRLQEAATILYAQSGYGTSLSADDASKVKALLNWEFPFAVRMNFKQFFAKSREAGYVGNVFDFALDWLKKNTRGHSFYTVQSAPSGGIWRFREKEDAEAFVAHFGGKLSKLESMMNAFRGDRINMVGVHHVTVGKQIEREFFSGDEWEEGYASLSEWCTLNIRGLWSLRTWPHMMHGNAVIFSFSLEDDAANFQTYLDEQLKNGAVFRSLRKARVKQSMHLNNN